MKKDPVTVVDARAIDVGYANVKLTLGRKLATVGPDKGGNVIATDLFPALAPVLQTGAARSVQGAPSADGCTVSIGGAAYFVGRGAIHHSKGIEPRPVADNYCMTDKYLALMRGAMYYMAQDARADCELVIKNLVLGLPLNTYYQYRQALADRATGEHIVSNPVGNGNCRITVENVDVIVQPAGALANFGLRSGRGHPGVSLVVDPGGGTLDWYLSNGRIPNLERSGAYPKAMLACAVAIANKINERWRDQFGVMEKIDAALREGSTSFVVQGKVYELAHYREVLDQVVEESIGQLLATVGPTDDIDQVLMTGGGAKLFMEHLIWLAPNLAPITKLDEDSVYSNVRGFQVVAEMRAAARV